MPVQVETYHTLKQVFDEKNICLVAVSKTKTPEEIMELYRLGHRDFGENYVQELIAKATRLPADIRWHFIGHLQSNKVKYIVPMIHLIHGVDSLKLLHEINKQSAKAGLITSCLLQVHISGEETKFGMSDEELHETVSAFLSGVFPSVRLRGLMGMASFTDDECLIRMQFLKLKSLFDKFNNQLKDFDTLSMGMSNDYRIAIECGSNMVRIGTLLFGERK
ncbi:MAG: YggS family pyridoxal phosphate-dependent enzyme [Chitinophagaceae bacterium]|nr:YggS family pyridoxal phosphate-dependent enzyme [Chitinophagaceae bacterium]